MATMISFTTVYGDHHLRDLRNSRMVFHPKDLLQAQVREAEVRVKMYFL